MFGFADMLAAKAEASRTGKSDRRNAPRTRLLIQIATCRLLQEAGYEKLSIRGICDAVDLTAPGFYLHYRNKQELVLEVLHGLVAAEAQMLPSLTDCDDLCQATWTVCDWYFRFHLHDEALFATLTEMRRSVPAADSLQDQRSQNLHKAISYQLDRFDEYRAIDKIWATFSLDATARAMNTTATTVNAQSGPISMHHSNDVNHLIDMFARLYYRSLTGDPLPATKTGDEDDREVRAPDLVNE